MANFSYRFSIYNINGETYVDVRRRSAACSPPSFMSGLCAEALNQGENVDLNALMADLSSIEQELSTINTKSSSSGMARLGLTDTKVPVWFVVDYLEFFSSCCNFQKLLSGLQVRQKPPAGRSSRQPSTGGAGAVNSVSGGGGSSGASSSSSSTRASPAGTIRAPSGQQGRPALASNFSLDDITAQLEKV